MGDTISDRTLIKCKCRNTLINLSIWQPVGKKISGCERYYLCPHALKNTKICDINNTDEQCPNFSTENIVEITCPYCGHINQLHLDLSDFIILPSRLNDIMLDKSKIYNGLAIDCILFEKTKTIIKLRRA